MVKKAYIKPEVMANMTLKLRFMGQCRVDNIVQKYVSTFKTSKYLEDIYTYYKKIKNG